MFHFTVRPAPLSSRIPHPIPPHSFVIFMAQIWNFDCSISFHKLFSHEIRYTNTHSHHCLHFAMTCRSLQVHLDHLPQVRNNMLTNLRMLELSFSHFKQLLQFFFNSNYALEIHLVSDYYYDCYYKWCYLWMHTWFHDPLQESLLQSPHMQWFAGHADQRHYFKKLLFTSFTQLVYVITACFTNISNLLQISTGNRDEDHINHWRT